MSARAPRGFRFPETGESPSAERPLLGERLGLVVRRVPRVDLDAEDRSRHRRDRVATAAGDGWALDCSAAGGGPISAALSQAAETLDVAS